MTKALSISLTSGIVTAVFFALMLVMSGSALAHGGGGALEVDPDAPNCMGQLARMHANGKEPGNNPDTMKGFGTNQSHPGLGGPYDSIQDQTKAFQEYCGIGM